MVAVVVVAVEQAGLRAPSAWAPLGSGGSGLALDDSNRVCPFVRPPRFSWFAELRPCGSVPQPIFHSVQPAACAPDTVAPHCKRALYNMLAVKVLARAEAAGTEL